MYVKKFNYFQHVVVTGIFLFGSYALSYSDSDANAECSAMSPIGQWDGQFCKMVACGEDGSGGGSGAIPRFNLLPGWNVIAAQGCGYDQGYSGATDCFCEALASPLITQIQAYSVVPSRSVKGQWSINIAGLIYSQYGAVEFFDGLTNQFIISIPAAVYGDQISVTLPSQLFNNPNTFVNVRYIDELRRPSNMLQVSISLAHFVTAQGVARDYGRLSPEQIYDIVVRGTPTIYGPSGEIIQIVIDPNMKDTMATNTKVNDKISIITFNPNDVKASDPIGAKDTIAHELTHQDVDRDPKNPLNIFISSDATELGAQSPIAYKGLYRTDEPIAAKFGLMSTVQDIIDRGPNDPTVIATKDSFTASLNLAADMLYTTPLNLQSAETALSRIVNPTDPNSTLAYSARSALVDNAPGVRAEVQYILQYEPSEKQLILYRQVIVDNILQSPQAIVVEPYVATNPFSNGQDAAKTLSDKLEGLRVNMVNPFTQDEMNISQQAMRVIDSISSVANTGNGSVVNNGAAGDSQNTNVPTIKYDEIYYENDGTASTSNLNGLLPTINTTGGAGPVIPPYLDPNFNGPLQPWQDPGFMGPLIPYDIPLDPSGE